MTKTIELTQGKTTVVDDEDYEYLSRWNWFYNHGYAGRNLPRKLGENRRILMHRVIANTPDGMYTDHINHDRLDNRRCNLRVCTNSQNQANRGKPTDNSSGVKGVRWDRNKWRAHIVFRNKFVDLGRFINIDDAAKAYKAKSIELFGEFACTGEEQ